MKASSKLKNLEVDGGILKITFNVSHYNGNTTLDQDLILKKMAGKWSANIEMKGFPDQESAQSAADKLSDWLQRLAIAIKTRRYETIVIEEIGNWREGEMQVGDSNQEEE